MVGDEGPEMRQVLNKMNLYVYISLAHECERVTDQQGTCVELRYYESFERTGWRDYITY